MSWLLEAQKIASEKAAAGSPGDGAFFFLKTEEEREAFKKELRKLYDNATEREMDRAIDFCLEKLSQPFTKDEVLKTIRPRLED